jgi:hypothetical protein
VGVVLHEDGGCTYKGDATFAEDAMDFRCGEARVGKIFEDLGADGEVELVVAKWERLADGGYIHQWSDLGIDGDVLTDAISEESAIGLKASPDVEYGEVPLRQTIKAGLKYAAAGAEY